MSSRPKGLAVTLALALMSLFSALAQTQSPSPSQRPALFEPPADKRLLIIGQDLGALGGFAKPNDDGYVNHIKIKPTGATTYLALPKLQGMTEKVNLFAGDLWAQAILDNPIFENSVLAIGLHFVDQEQNIVDGKFDSQIDLLAEWIKKAKRPVLLRIGYEFDGSWNHYNPENYKKAFKRIVDRMRALKVTNCATVWQAATSPVNGRGSRTVENWYPGDDYVDWMGYSWFLTGAKQVAMTDELVNFARAHGKPVMVCESAPQGYDLARLTRGSIAGGKDKKPKTPDQIWKEWYVPYFDYLEKNKDVIKIVAYINVNWDAQWMWGYPYMAGYWGDSRVEVNDEIKKRWLEVIEGDEWMKATPDLFQQLQSGKEKAPSP